MPIYVGEDISEEIASNKSGDETGSKIGNSEVSRNNSLKIGVFLSKIAETKGLCGLSLRPKKTH